MTKKWKRISKLWRDSSGFTLVELIVVLSIITIVGGTVLVTSRGMQRRTLNNASLTLQAEMRRAQRMAIIEGRRWRVQFDPAYNRYQIHSVPRSQAERIYTTYLPPGVEIDFWTPRAYLDFLPRGTVSSGFSIHLVNGNYLQISTATVSAGRISVHEIELLTR